MKKIVFLCAILLSFAISIEKEVTMNKVTNPSVIMETSQGKITIELYQDQAPVTVKNFLQYVDDGFYTNTIFHRVIKKFMIQGGGMVTGLEEKETREPIINEAGNGLKNERGTLAMARTSDVNSATAQFFINLVDNSFLDHQDDTDRGFGYCVFGKVTEGMDVVDKIAKAPTTSFGYHQDVPREEVTILSVTRK
jgi:peptidyl-prolyl cis-trans isomerase B (cyclophilin B)